MTKLTCPKCGEWIDLKTDLALPKPETPEPWVELADRLGFVFSDPWRRANAIDAIRITCEQHAATVTAQLQKERNNLIGELQDERERHRAALNLLSKSDAEFANVMDERDRAAADKESLRIDRDRWERAWHEDTDALRAELQKIKGLP